MLIVRFLNKEFLEIVIAVDVFIDLEQFPR